MSISLDQIESRLRELVEIRLPSVLPGAKPESILTRELTKALRSDVREAGDRKFAPDTYALLTHPQNSASWRDPRLLDLFRMSLQTAALEAGLEFASPPTLSLAADPSLGPSELKIVASHKFENLESTDVVAGGPIPEADTSIPENAFLIIEGRKVFPLKTSVVNIGRRLENQLVIDDPRISRTHTQLRAIKGRFVVFDLNSTGGTHTWGEP